MAPCRTTPSPKASCRRFRGRVGNGFTGRFRQVVDVSSTNLEVEMVEISFFLQVKHGRNCCNYTQVYSRNATRHLMTSCAWCVFFPVGRFWILQKLGQVGLIDASYTTSIFDQFGLSVIDIFNENHPHHIPSHPWDPCVCWIPPWLPLFPPQKKLRSPPSNKNNDGWEMTHSQIEKARSSFFWGGRVPLRSLGEKPPMENFLLWVFSTQPLGNPRRSGLLHSTRPRRIHRTRAVVLSHFVRMHLGVFQPPKR